MDINKQILDFNKVGDSAKNSLIESKFSLTPTTSNITRITKTEKGVSIPIPSTNEISSQTDKIEFKRGGKYLIRKNLKGILDNLLEEISDFKQSSHMKLKSISVLYYLVKSCGVLLSPYMEKILYPLYTYIDSEEEISRKCEETAIMMGLVIDQNILIPLLTKHLTEADVKNSYQPLYGRLKVFSNILSKMANINAENISHVIRLLNNLEVFSLPSEGVYTKGILFCAYKIFESLTLNLGAKNCMNYHEELFFPLLLFSSLPETASFHSQVKSTISKLSNFCGFEDTDSLFSLELGCVLDKFKTSHKSWRRNSPDRFAFDTYIRNGGQALDKHWIEVLMIISYCCEADKDIEMRIDMMILLEFCLDRNELSEQIKSYVEFILPEILVPASAWKALRPNGKIRKAALVCMIKLFKNELIDTQTAIGFFDDILLVLKSTLEDDWDPEMRFLSITLMKFLLNFCKENVDDGKLVDLYPHILKRLDDSQDANRILACEVFSAFFKICQRVRISQSTYEYIINAAFIHLDDPNEDVRKAVLAFLKEAKGIYADVFKAATEKNLNNFVHKSAIKELL